MINLSILDDIITPSALSPPDGRRQDNIWVKWPFTADHYNRATAADGVYSQDNRRKDIAKSVPRRDRTFRQRVSMWRGVRIAFHWNRITTKKNKKYIIKNKRTISMFFFFLFW